MSEGKKPTETGGGEGSGADRPTLDQLDSIIAAERLRRELQISEHDVRRLIDVQDALTFPMPGPGADLHEQLAYRNALRLGILSAQSLDELGPEGNARAHEQEMELQRRLERLRRQR